MAKDTPKSTHSDRLIKAAEHIRARNPVEVTRNLVIEPRTAAKPVQHAIKYPNTSTALRRLVETRKEQKPTPTVRLRARPLPETAEAKPVRLRERPPAESIKTRDPVRARTAEVLAVSDTRSEQLPGSTKIRAVFELGEIVRRARRGRGLSQAELARLAGTGRRFVSELEAGKPTVEFERLLKVCRTLGISLLAAVQPDDR